MPVLGEAGSWNIAETFLRKHTDKEVQDEETKERKRRVQTQQMKIEQEKSWNI